MGSIDVIMKMNYVKVLLKINENIGKSKQDCNYKNKIMKGIDKTITICYMNKVIKDLVQCGLVVGKKEGRINFITFTKYGEEVVKILQQMMEVTNGKKI